MADDRVPSQPVNRLLLVENTFPLPLHQPHGHVQQHVANHYVAGEDAHRPQPVGNVDMQGQMGYHPHHIDAPNYDPAHYHPPPPAYPEVPYMHMQRDMGAAQGVPAHAQVFAPQVQENHAGQFGYGAQFPGADPQPPEAFPPIWPHPAPLANMPPANRLRNFAIRYLNDPDTRVNMVRIEPGPGGRVSVLIALELGDIF